MNTKITTTLEKIEADIAASKNATWNISRETGIFLNTLVRIKKPARILEIGTSTGYSGIWLAEPLHEIHGECITIESHDERFAAATEHFTQADLLDVIKQVKGHAPEIFPKIEGMFDMMFFDATKTEHTSYFAACESRLNVNGIIITDNIISHKDELADYIAMVQQKKNFQSSILRIGTGLMISLKLS